MPVAGLSPLPAFSVTPSYFRISSPPLKGEFSAACAPSFASDYRVGLISVYLHQNAKGRAARLREDRVNQDRSKNFDLDIFNNKASKIFENHQ
jgi:hypothetical protein